jgi:hypothetical protein
MLNLTNNVVQLPENKFFTPAYKCSVCRRYFDGFVYGQLVRGSYRFSRAKPIFNLCENCFFILCMWTAEIAQAAAADGGGTS